MHPGLVPVQCHEQTREHDRYFVVGKDIGAKNAFERDDRQPPEASYLGYRVNGNASLYSELPRMPISSFAGLRRKPDLVITDPCIIRASANQAISFKNRS